MAAKLKAQFGVGGGITSQFGEEIMPGVPGFINNSAILKCDNQFNNCEDVNHNKYLCTAPVIEGFQNSTSNNKLYIALLIL